MKTRSGHFFIIFDVDDFWEKVDYWKSKGKLWIMDYQENYSPRVCQDDMPVVLSIDNFTMMFSKIITGDENPYFSDPRFVKLYKKELRKRKFKRLINEKD
jgi:hypothetical protein